MYKRIIAAAICLVLASVVMVACGKKEPEIQPDPTAASEYTTDTDGNVYVTNIHGDLIPVTTGKDGSVEMMEDLITKTTEQVSREQASIAEEENKNQDDSNNNNENNNNNNNNNNDNDNDNDNDNETPDTDADKDGIVVGTDSLNSGEHDAVINWN